MSPALRRAFLLLLVPLLACSGSRTEIVVVVDSDLIVPDQIDNVRVEVTGTVAGPVVSSGALTGSNARPLPRTVGVVHTGGPLGPVEIRAEARLLDMAVTDRVAVTEFRKGKTLVLRLFLDRRCLFLTCPGADDTCIDGRCGSPLVDPLTLPEWTGSVPGPDAGADTAPSCEPVAETCNRLDDDCDGITDEDFDHTSDPLHCGGCNNVCPSGPGAEAMCRSGACRLLCDAGLEDCNGIPQDGCEQMLNTIDHCGACGMLCTLDHATSSCATGMCEVDTCDAGFDDCNGTAADGCEEDLSSSVAHCGMCGHACVLDHATATCDTGACVVETCDASFGDCDTFPETGCEEDLTSSADHCGMCNLACGAGSICLNSMCRQTSEAVAVGAGGGHSCAVRVTGEVVCWGDNTSGQLGDGNLGTASLVPVLVTGVTDAVAVTGGSAHTCVLRVTGEVACFGDDTSGQLGDGMAGAPSDTPVAVVGLTDAVEVVAGGAHTCARRASGAVVCWGDGTSSQLGNGGGSSAVPVQAGSIADAVSIAAGGLHSCTVRMGGEVLCWGDNGMRQIGDGTGALERATPTSVRNLTNAVVVTAGTGHTCAILGTGAVLCWGDNASGQLGNGGTGGTENLPVPVTGVTDAVQVGGGEAHTCVRHADMTLSCWGDNTLGQLGDDSGAASDTPVAVMGLVDAIGMAVGGLHACAVRPTGEALCWGGNVSGQIGDNTTNPATVPVGVVGVP